VPGLYPIQTCMARNSSILLPASRSGFIQLHFAPVAI
jgi:hypothetical protein